MAFAHPPAHKGSSVRPPHFTGEECFDAPANSELARLTQENARLRTLVTELSSLVLKHVADRK